MQRPSGYAFGNWFPHNSGISLTDEFSPAQVPVELDGLDHSRLPQHVAIIMDGNGRWATQRRKHRIEGHRRGKTSVRVIVEMSRKIGIRYLSLYAFSTENWLRPDDEVEALMSLLEHYLVAEQAKMMRYGIRLLAVGDRSRLPAGVRRTLEQVIETTADNQRMTVVLALSYSGRDDIVRMARNLAQQVQAGTCRPEAIDDAWVSAHLDTAGIPDPDLLIRTSGELRISNFFLWQLAYSELYITPTLWPDFREKAYLEALLDYQRRRRRFGRTDEQIAAAPMTATEAGERRS